MFGVGFLSVAVFQAGVLGGSAVAAAAPAATLPSPVPIADLVQPPALRGAQLSPSGAYLALIETAAGRDSAVVLELSTGARRTVFESRERASLAWLRWKGEDRLLAGSVPQSGPEGLPPGREAVFSIGRDGGEVIALSGDEAMAGDGDPVRLSDPMASDPRHVMIVAPGRKGAPSLWRVDVHSGAAQFVRDGEGDDDGLPGGAMVVRYSRDLPPDAAQDQGMVALGPAEGKDRVYALVVPQAPDEGDTTTVRVFDFRTGVMSGPVWPTLRYDVQDIVYRAGGQALAGVCYVAETYACDFKDATLQADYDHARAQLGGAVSVTPLSQSDDGQAWLLGVTGPREPGAYFLFDRRSRALKRVADRFPAVEAEQLGEMKPFVYTARDGTRIPGYVTLPPNPAAGPLPMVVMPHGGPEVRDALGYDRWAQAVATRGYLVFQPNFRGSSGYGRAWTEAGYGQWGGRMQDDLTDGVEALVKAGMADPKRICIAGASYGGYAALYGGATQPELYRCVVSVAGVSDLKALVEHEKRTNGADSGEYHYARAVIGDPEADRRKLERTSPISYAQGFRPPVLMLHGEHDRSVPLAQSQQMAAALKAAGRDVRLMVMPGEGHADWSPEHETEALTAVTDFVKANIGG